MCLACVLVIAALAAATPAAASPQDVVADFGQDGQIDGDYSITDLHNAKRLMLRLNPARSPEFTVIVDEKINSEFLGIQPDRDPAVTPTPSIPSADAPAWIAATAIAAALFGLAGIAAAVYRRSRRQAG